MGFASLAFSLMGAEGGLEQDAVAGKQNPRLSTRALAASQAAT